jgi:hypothetical protein
MPNAGPSAASKPFSKLPGWLHRGQPWADRKNNPPRKAPGVKRCHVNAWVTGEAAGVGAWGRTFQVWGSWFSWGTSGGANGVSTVQTHQSVSELTTRPRLGKDCWSRGLQSALLLGVLRWGVCHQWRLPGLMNTDSLRRWPRTISLYTHCSRPLAGETWSDSCPAPAQPP